MRVSDPHLLHPADRLSKSSRRKRLHSLTAATLLLFYGYELIAMPLAMAAQTRPVANTGSAAKQDALYLLYAPQRGEGLADIARRFGVDEASLTQVHQQARSAGWSEQVWLVPKAATGEATLYPGYVLHTLQPGESLGYLALRNNRSERELTRLNAQVLGNTALTQLKPGAQVVLPAPLAATEGHALATSEAQAFEQRLAQGVTQTAQGYETAQASGVSAGGVLAQQAAGQASGALSQGAEALLSPYGRAKVGVRINSETENVELEFDYLHPWLEDSQSILFTQLGGRRFDERYIGNLGLGYRQLLNPDLMLGANAFLDQDFSRDHNRVGAGVEAWTDTARLAANAYVPLSDWKRSHERHLNSDPERFDLYERAAKGWDARGEALIPNVPQLAATARYFQWYGEGVDVFGGGQLEKDPRGYGLGLRWQPIPLLGFSAEHQQIQHGDKSWEMGVSVNWSFDRDLSKQLNTQGSAALRPLAQARQDFVQRENNLVLDYKQKEKPQETPFAFASDDLTLQAPPLGAPTALNANSPALQGVRSGAVVSYSLASSARSTAAVSIDASSGVVTVPPGTSTQSFITTATQTVNGVVVGTTHYTLQIQETLDSNAPTAPTLSVTDSNQDLKPELSGQAEAGSTVEVTWPDGSSSSVVADGSGNWSVEAPTAQPSGPITAVSKDAAGNTSPPSSAAWENISAPVASNVAISGTAQVGEVLTGSYTYSDAQNDPEGASRLQWYRGTTAITGATQINYTPQVADEGQSLTFAVTPVAVSGEPTEGLEVKSSPTAALAGKPGAAPVADAVTVSGSPIVGQVLSSSYLYSDADGDLEGATTIQWNRAGVAIAGATQSSYRLVTADQGSSVSVTITPIAQTGVPKVGTAVQSTALQVVGNTDNFLQPDTAVRTWGEADAFCQSQGGHLPSGSELQQLYVDATTATAADGSQRNQDMCSLHNWPLGAGGCGGSTTYYWSSDSSPVGTYPAIELIGGTAMNVPADARLQTACYH